MQKSLIYAKNLEKQEILSHKFIDAKRSAKGIGSLFVDKIIGKKLKKNVRKNQKIKFGDLK